jgi:hypothetical protein
MAAGTAAWSQVPRQLRALLKRLRRSKGKDGMQASIVGARKDRVLFELAIRCSSQGGRIAKIAGLTNQQVSGIVRWQICLTQRRDFPGLSVVGWRSISGSVVCRCSSIVALRGQGNSGNQVGGSLEE